MSIKRYGSYDISLSPASLTVAGYLAATVDFLVQVSPAVVLVLLAYQINYPRHFMQTEFVDASRHPTSQSFAGRWLLCVS
jgi:hypothetical protein